MKLKYKKIILLTTMSTMGIGILTLSVSQDSTKAQESLNSTATMEAGLLADNESTEVETTMMAKADETAALDAAVTVTPSPIPSPTPSPVYEIEKTGTYPEIDSLFEKYYTAKNNHDVDTLKSILSDPSKADTQEQLESKTEYIEEYRNIKTYTKKGVEDGTYIVYVYHEIKFAGVNTPAPGLAKFYVTPTGNKDLKIFSSDMNEELKKYYDERNEDEDVLAIIDMTNKKSEQAKADDEDLQNFWENIDKMASSKKSAEAQGDSNE